MRMFHLCLFSQHNSKILYLNKTWLDSSCLNGQAILLEYTSKGVYQINYFDSSCLNGQAILLEYNTSKGVYQINYFNFNFNFILTLIITLTLTLYLASFTVALLVGVFVEFLHFFNDFQPFLKKFSNFFSTHFFGIFELRWQCSKFWLRWINFIFSKWLSYSRFKKSILPSSQVENVTAYHPSTIYA